MITALALEPDQDEMAACRRLRAASPYATPNPRLIEIGDTMLGRGGRLIRASGQIGRGADAFEGSRFCLATAPR
jgi:predicted protein tyrosine phosphatase